MLDTVSIDRMSFAEQKAEQEPSLVPIRIENGVTDDIVSVKEDTTDDGTTEEDGYFVHEIVGHTIEHHKMFYQIRRYR